MSAQNFEASKVPAHPQSAKGAYSPLERCNRNERNRTSRKIEILVQLPYVGGALTPGY